MKDEHTHGKKMARNGRTKVIYKGAFISKQSLIWDLVPSWKIVNTEHYFLDLRNIQPIKMTVKEKKVIFLSENG